MDLGIAGRKAIVSAFSKGLARTRTGRHFVIDGGAHRGSFRAGATVG